MCFVSCPGLAVELDAASQLSIVCAPSEAGDGDVEDGAGPPSALDASLRLALTAHAAVVLKVKPRVVLARFWSYYPPAPVACTTLPGRCACVLPARCVLDLQ